MDTSEAARLLGKMPKKRQVQQTCPMCGRTFQTTRRGIYCSPPCRSKAQRQREAQARKATAAAESAEA